MNPQVGVTCKAKNRIEGILNIFLWPFIRCKWEASRKVSERKAKVLPKIGKFLLSPKIFHKYKGGVS